MYNDYESRPEKEYCDEHWCIMRKDMFFNPATKLFQKDYEDYGGCSFSTMREAEIALSVALEDSGVEWVDTCNPLAEWLKECEVCHWTNTYETDWA